MTVSDLVNKLIQLPLDLDVQVMIDESSDLADVASVEFVGGQPFNDDDLFVVIEVSHTKSAGSDLTKASSSLKFSN
jgi:hypothetical protein